MNAFRTSSGETLRIGGVLGKGGEGTVYHVDGQTDVAAKIYTDGKHLERRDKISFMVASELYKKSDLVAFPMDILQRNSGEFVGFTMRKIGRSKAIHELYAPGSRKAEFPHADFRFLVRTATNLARAIGSVLNANCVIGDINHSGILVNDKAMVTLIDADSFQFRSGTRVFRSLVGTGEYTPPELQGVLLRDVDREPQHDAFGLAVLIFQLLFMGRHPYAGRYSGSGDMPIEKAIREGRFAYSSRRSETMMDSPPFVPTLADVTPDLASAFERAFTSAPTSFNNRPSPADWVTFLTAFETQLVPCRVISGHHHPRNASSCPWCRLEAGMQVSLFPLPGQGKAPTLAGRNFDLTAAIAAIDRIASPGPSPEPVKLMPPLGNLAKTEEAARAVQDLLLRRTGGVFLIVAALLAISAGVPPVLASIMFLGVFLFREGDTYAKLRNTKAKAADHWKQVCQEWTNEAGPQRFERRKGELEKLANEYRQLDTVERNRLSDLERRRRELQLQRFLEGHKIARAKIPGIGDGRKATLASYGIEDAFDIAQHRILGVVPGFGDAMTGRLLEWRISIESKFVFNPHTQTDPASIQKVKDDVARRRAEIQQALLRGPLQLEQMRTHSMSLRNKPTPRLTDAYRALRQAEIDVS